MTEQNQMVSLNTVGPISPPLLHLTDGGHLDNLGLIELLRRECKLMICFDAGLIQSALVKTWYLC